MHQTRHDADSYQRVEVITGLRRRRDWSDAEKARILAESADPEVNISEVARRNGVSRGLLNVWRRKARLATIEGPPFVQIRLDDGAEARPDAIDQPRWYSILDPPATRSHPKAKRRDKMPTSFDDSRATLSLKDQRSRTGTDSLPTPLPSGDESSRQSRKRTIMGRYVFGDELKPGERWKRRLLIAR
jgi:transposase